MRRSLPAGVVVLLLLAGCEGLPKRHVDLNFSRYHDPEFTWQGVNRLVLMPLLNETDQPCAAVELNDALSAEFQRMGLFEVVVAPTERYAHLSKTIREGGRFDEGELIEIARCFRADAILMGTVSQYRPYQRPRIGLSLQVVSPDTGKVIASVDGLWDSTSHEIANRAQRFYTRQSNLAEKACDCVLGTIDTSYAADLVLDSPLLFRRFVCYEAAIALVQRLIPVDTLAPNQRPNGDHYHVKPVFGPSTPSGLWAQMKKLCTSEKPPEKPKEKPPEKPKEKPPADPQKANPPSVPPSSTGDAPVPPPARDDGTPR